MLESEAESGERGGTPRFGGWLFTGVLIMLLPLVVMEVVVLPALPFTVMPSLGMPATQAREEMNTKVDVELDCLSCPLYPALLPIQRDKCHLYPDQEQCLTFRAQSRVYIFPFPNACK